MEQRPDSRWGQSACILARLGLQTRGRKWGGEPIVCPWGARCQDNRLVTQEGGSDISDRQAESPSQFWELAELLSHEYRERGHEAHHGLDSVHREA